MEDIPNNYSNNSLKCPECHADNAKNAKFCGECGIKLQFNEDSEKKIPCSKCGTLNRPGATFCADCGKNLATGRTPKKHKKRKMARKLYRGSRGIVKSTRSQGLVKTAKKETWHTLRLVDDLSGGKLRKLDEKYHRSPKNNPYGYLICDSCYGYYELKEGVSPHKFKKCACGGNLSYSRTLSKY